MVDEELVLDAGDFRSWLWSQAGGSLVGLAVHARSCPLSQYLTMCCGGGWLVSAGVCCRANDRNQWHRLPWWAEQFVAEVDEAVFALGGPITRELALAVLDRILFTLRWA